MKLKLLITKKETSQYRIITKTKHLFAVIDLDKSKKYPQNFVCVLPKTINLKVRNPSKFVIKYGDKSLEMAIQLLKKALRSRPDSETAKAIRERLKLLDPQLHNKAKCMNCGKPLKQSKRNVRPYKFCFKCHSEGYPKR